MNEQSELKKGFFIEGAPIIISASVYDNVTKNSVTFY